MPKGIPAAKSNAAQTESATGKPTNKMEGMRQALADLGKDAKPADLMAYVKDQFNMKLTPATVSTYKSSILRKEGKGKRGRPKGSKNVKASNGVASVATKVAAGSISLDDIRAVKAVIDRLGAAKVLELATVLAK